MVVKDIALHENLSMENNHRTLSAMAPIMAAGNDYSTTTGHGRRCTFSYFTAIIIVSFFICTLLAEGFIIYNFATCPHTSVSDEYVLCKKINLSPTTKTKNNEESSELTNNNANKTTKYEHDVRLPRSIKPLKYNISIVPQLNGNFTFEGQVQIQVHIVEDCYNITMHVTELNITKNDVAVYHINPKKNSLIPAKSLRIRKQYILEAKQFFIIELYDKLVRDTEYEIHIKFNGIIQDYLQGFYRSSYQVHNETRWLASTQFQATDARRAFPCFDEPALKANFTLHIARPTNMSTISNMPIVATTKHSTLPNYVWDHFAESLPMSTYLVAYAITDFSHLNLENFSVWARTDAMASAQYALSVGPKILKYLENFFDVPFPLPKIDMIALPDFQAGAMENWGLITYRETTMLYEENQPITNRQRVASVVGHELAHQWFGNLVTPSWWSDIWLNEGFASYMEYLTVNAIEPNWKILDQFVVNELQNVFQLDALSTSHKISVKVLNPDEITEIFDRISYGKGSTILHMMNHFLTTQVFCKGLSKYLKEMAYNSATQDDLWHFLTNEAKSSGLLDGRATVKEIMDTWTLQTGYPVVKVLRYPYTYVIRLEQERFVFTNNTKSQIEPLWWIPITYTTANELNFENTKPITWIPRTKIYEIESEKLANADWFIFNIQQTGYYRINYELDNWRAITKHLMDADHFADIVPANRAQLIDDVMNLARGSYLPYETALNLTRYLAHEMDYVPWKAAINNFNFIDGMFVNQGDYDLLKNYLLELLMRIYISVGFQYSVTEPMLLHFKRVEILSLACHLGHSECISESSRLFQNWLQAPNPDVVNPISPNLRSFVYCTAIHYGTEKEWNFAFERYLKSSASAEQELLLSALGCSKEPWILFRYLRRAISSQNIRKQDVYRVFAGVSSNVVGQQIAFEFLRNNWEDIKAYLGSSISNMYTLLNFATKRLNSKYQLTQLNAFVHNDLKDNGRSIQQILERVQTNIEWMNRNYMSIVKWLKAETGNSP